MDLFVLPSFTEGLPVVLLEVFAFEKCVIASDVGGVPELVKHGESGILVKQGSEKELCQAILSMFREPDARKRMGKSARQSLEREFSLEVRKSEILDFYRKIINHKSPVMSGSA
jgi:glycosyltransferase involved in cell wall biosynthesis